MELKMKSIYVSSLMLMLMLFSCNHTNLSLYRIQENGKFGFINNNGEVVIEPQYKYVGYFNKDGYATVITDFHYKVDKVYKSVLSSNLVDTILYIKYGFIDTNNRLVVDTTNVMRLTKMQVNLLGIDNVKLLVENFKENKIPFQEKCYDEKIKLNSKLFPIQNQNNFKMGYMNLSGDTIIPTIYEDCLSFHNGLACVEKINKMDETDIRTILNNKILIDTLGNEITSDSYLYIRNFTQGDKTWANKIEADEDENLIRRWYLLDKLGNVCSTNISGNNIIVYNSKSDLYVWEYELIVYGRYLGTYYSFIDSNGKFATDFNNDGELSFENETFRDVTYMSEDIVGLKIQYQGAKAWAFADKNFEFKSQPFDSLLQFTDTLAAVKGFSKGGYSKWGFINKNYEVVIPYKYDAVSSFNGELAYFCVSNIEGYINKKGEIVWKTTRKN